jgi:glycolate oxidase iron-sulfur subunit
MNADGMALPCALPGSPLDKAKAGLDACVHCGFCLQACPTYLALDDENDSPRGRLLLMRELLNGGLTRDDPSLNTHIDRCLGCRACETACPSGVPYGHLLEATRATIADAKRLPLIGRAVLFVFSRAPLLALVLGAARLLRATRLPSLLARLPGQAGAAMAMLASSGDRPRPTAYTARGGGERGTFAILRGCVMRHLFAHTNRATERTLVVNGYAARETPGQHCCGALHAHAGDLTGARQLARRNIEAFERSPTDFIVVNAAGCGAMMKEYGHLLADDPAWVHRARAVAVRVRDISELLAAAGPVQGGTLGGRVTYDAPCHLLHAQRVVSPPLAVLAAIPGLEVIPLTESDQCCGGAGIYNLLEPETSALVLGRKIAHIREAFEVSADGSARARPGSNGATTRAAAGSVDRPDPETNGKAWLATGNPGCHMQIGAGMRLARIPIRVTHPVDLLDASYAIRRP